jgi:hypothetical protein
MLACPPIQQFPNAFLHTHDQEVFGSRKARVRIGEQEFAIKYGATKWLSFWLDSKLCFMNVSFLGKGLDYSRKVKSSELALGIDGAHLRIRFGKAAC